MPCWFLYPTAFIWSRLSAPSVSNSHEAEILFNLPELARPGGPVLLEAAHNCFHPSWRLFRSLPWAASKEGIHFNYEVAGGCLMAMGCYSFAVLREVFGAEPTGCIDCTTHHYTDGIYDRCDWGFRASFAFPQWRYYHKG
ncbi:hypothetical protein F5Y07DRAFT_393269 [Xylaria sp. FL0933]|nr:hypothetical protein F5Y07DRAFT_393269 [Xylaria sp. FL0933]